MSTFPSEGRPSCFPEEEGGSLVYLRRNSSSPGPAVHELSPVLTPLRRRGVSPAPGGERKVRSATISVQEEGPASSFLP